MGAESFHENGRTDTIKLIIAFRNFANAPTKKKGKVVPIHAMKAYRGLDVYSTRSLTSGLDGGGL